MAEICIKRFLIPLSEEDAHIIDDWTEYLNIIKDDEIGVINNIPRVRRSFKEMFGYTIVISSYFITKQY